MLDGHTPFMSNKTKDKLDADVFKTGTPNLKNLKFPMDFELITWKKTGDAVSDWMFSCIGNTKVHSGDFNLLSADGSSNAVGSIQELEVVG